MDVTARATRSGRWWAIEVPEVEGARSQARRLDQVAEMAAEAVATMLDIEPGDVTVTDVAPVLDGFAEVHRATEAARIAREAQLEATKRAGQAVRTLLDSGMSMRDVGVLMGITHQRVWQIAHRDAR